VFFMFFDGHIHQYLGDVDIVSHNDALVLSHGTELTVRVIVFPSVVLFPGESLPLLLNDSQLQSMLNSGDRLFGVSHANFPYNHPHLSVITLAEIRYQGRTSQSSGLDSEALIAMGKCRMKVRSIKRHFDKCMATGTILEDAPTRLPIEAKRNLAYWGPSVWQKYDVRLLMKQARQLAAYFEVGVAERADAMHPTDYSFWLARNLPFSDNVRQALLEMTTTHDRLNTEITLLKRWTAIACKHCGFEISTPAHLLNMSTEGTLGTYVNAYGHIHETLTVKRLTRGVAMDPAPPSTQQSWFPGYAWTIIYCANCRSHIGWKYTAVGKDLRPNVFWGLRRPALLLA